MMYWNVIALYYKVSAVYYTVIAMCYIVIIVYYKLIRVYCKVITLFYKLGFRAHLAHLCVSDVFQAAPRTPGALVRFRTVPGSSAHM